MVWMSNQGLTPAEIMSPNIYRETPACRLGCHDEATPIGGHRFVG